MFKKNNLLFMIMMNVKKYYAIILLWTNLNKLERRNDFLI